MALVYSSQDNSIPRGELGEFGDSELVRGSGAEPTLEEFGRTRCTRVRLGGEALLHVWTSPSHLVCPPKQTCRHPRNSFSIFSQFDFCLPSAHRSLASAMNCLPSSILFLGVGPVQIAFRIRALLLHCGQKERKCEVFVLLWHLALTRFVRRLRNLPELNLKINVKGLVDHPHCHSRTLQVTTVPLGWFVPANGVSATTVP